MAFIDCALQEIRSSEIGLLARDLKYFDIVAWRIRAQKKYGLTTKDMLSIIVSQLFCIQE